MKRAVFVLLALLVARPAAAQEEYSYAEDEEGQMQVPGGAGCCGTSTRASKTLCTDVGGNCVDTKMFTCEAGQFRRGLCPNDPASVLCCVGEPMPKLPESTFQPPEVLRRGSGAPEREREEPPPTAARKMRSVPLDGNPCAYCAGLWPASAQEECFSVCYEHHETMHARFKEAGMELVQKADQAGKPVAVEFQAGDADGPTIAMKFTPLDHRKPQDVRVRNVFEQGSTWAWVLLATGIGFGIGAGIGEAVDPTSIGPGRAHYGAWPIGGGIGAGVAAALTIAGFAIWGQEERYVLPADGP